jgi:hypothetical protein
MNLVAAAVALISDFSTQILIEGKTLQFRKRKEETSDDSVVPISSESPLVEDTQETAVSLLRMIKFAGLNMVILVPTTIWVGHLEQKYPSMPLLQSAITWVIWNPIMFSVALTYRGIVTPEDGDAPVLQSICRTFQTEFKYLPYVYCYAIPIVLINFYVVPLEWVPIFMVVVDFFSDMFGSWWLHRRRNIEAIRKSASAKELLPQDASDEDDGSVAHTKVE